jgi:alpha-galactosidase
MSFFNLRRTPDTVMAHLGAEVVSLTPQGEKWAADDLVLEIQAAGDNLSINLTAETTPLEYVRIRWRLVVPGGLLYSGDHWERGYGDFEWRGLVPDRILPWYFLVYDGRLTHGYGVKTQPGAFCFWTVDTGGVNLWLDVRNGGAGVELGGRTLLAAQVITWRGQPGETPFQSAHSFCRQLCDSPRLPAQPVYGSNNWYYAYGHSHQAAILDDARLLASLAPSVDNRPFMVIDAGWQPLSGEAPENIICGGPYSGSNPRFPDMARLAAELRATGVRPGLWIRPLAAYPDDPESLLLPVRRALDNSARIKVMDPSLPEVLQRIRTDFEKLRGWGYDLIKHDWATCDIFGRWGFQMGTRLTNQGWHFADRNRTNAEITLALYRAIRQGAGEAIVIGCNTVGHLGAGLFELQRIGDDTSGREWERTRKMGINTLAFRGFQHGAFFAADPDCVGQTAAMPWEQNRQFLQLISRSGTVLFVSIDPALLNASIEGDLKAAFMAASQQQPLGEPLDWLSNNCPSRWRLNDQEVQFDWFGQEGVLPASLTTPS